MAPLEIGQKIKEVFDARQIKLTDFADELGTVRQNVYRIFRKRHLDTGLLLKISQVLDYNFFEYYITPKNDNAANDHAGLTTALELSRKEIEYLRKIIRLMEDKIELIQKMEETKTSTDSNLQLRVNR